MYLLLLEILGESDWDRNGWIGNAMHGFGLSGCVNLNINAHRQSNQQMGIWFSGIIPL